MPTLIHRFSPADKGRQLYWSPSSPDSQTLEEEIRSRTPKLILVVRVVRVLADNLADVEIIRASPYSTLPLEGSGYRVGQITRANNQEICYDEERVT